MKLSTISHTASCPSGSRTITKAEARKVETHVCARTWLDRGLQSQWQVSGARSPVSSTASCSPRHRFSAAVGILLSACVRRPMLCDRVGWSTRPTNRWLVYETNQHADSAACSWLVYETNQHQPMQITPAAAHQQSFAQALTLRVRRLQDQDRSLRRPGCHDTCDVTTPRQPDPFRGITS